MPKMNIAARTAGLPELIATNTIHSIGLILAIIPVPFVLYYASTLHLLGEDFQTFFTTVAFTVALCVLIYATVRVLTWLLYVVVVPGLAWLLYIAVHGFAWLLRTVIVPGLEWLVCVALPILARQLYGGLCSLARQLQNLGRSLKHGRAQRA
jgi:hypothetical protein